MFKRTHWAKTKGPESEFVKRISLVAAMYIELEKKFGQEKAFEIVRKIAVPIGSDEQWEHLKSMDLAGLGPMGRLMAFHDLMDLKGAPRLNTREYIEQNDNTCHFVITRCIFHEFFVETGTPQLTQLFCEVDREFFPNAFPEFEFHRNGSWQNTIAYCMVTKHLGR
ncbi:MAG: L-2-amino-thiazoline-4-carboxylic acid hydrolase [Candidatus Thorarchaeota archaeon]|nr:L-2-amino-thiazoline-4-carboxylic acid hydrolase [Candidatus Thorarchaeota archaeon]